MTEVWKDVKGYEGYYQVSNLGNVRRIGKTKNMVLVKNTKGYMHVCLSVNGRAKTVLVHILVAEAFLEKIDGCNVINHLDNDPSNNVITNLERTTQKGNIQHSIKQNRFRASFSPLAREKHKEMWERPVIGQNEKEVLYYKAIVDAVNDGFDRGNISACCRGKRKTHKGYIWIYAENA